MKTTTWKRWAVGGAAAITVIAGSLWAVDGVSAAAPEPTTADSVAVQALQTVGFGPGQMERGNRQFGALSQRDQAGQTLLAEALGITVEELQSAQDTAQTKAHDAALAQAVADGELTQAQADAMKELEGLWGNRGAERFRMGTDDHDAYLAEALGISVEELQAAKDAAMQAGLAEAVADGSITQEQADEMRARLALKDYLAAELDGVLQAAIQQALQDGVITQEQADALLDDNAGFFGHGMRGDFPGGMRDGFGRGMRGDFDGGMRGESRGGMRGGFPGGRWDDSAEPETQSGNSLYVTPGSQL